MYFQNPPTNFIDKFILIINQLQMNVNFFLGHQCKILRLTSKKRKYSKSIIITSISQSLLVRRNILRLYRARAVMIIDGICHDIICDR